MSLDFCGKIEIPNAILNLKLANLAESWIALKQAWLLELVVIRSIFHTIKLRERRGWVPGSSAWLSHDHCSHLEDLSEDGGFCFERLPDHYQQHPGNQWKHKFNVIHPTITGSEITVVTCACVLTQAPGDSVAWQGLSILYWGFCPSITLMSFYMYIRQKLLTQIIPQNNSCVCRFNYIYTKW